ncbi:MAG: YceI family protein [Bacteriovoracaceae bacterium]|nr:YceI family protein [Bacteriovoracaceae bacterium]
MKILLLLSIFISSQAFSVEVDLGKSSFSWLGTKVTGKHKGLVSLKKATVKTNKKNTLTSGEFVIDLNTISVTDLEGEWKQKFEGHIKSPDFFNTQKFPTSKLIVNKVDDKFLYGKLTIKGKTRPVTIPYKVNGKEYKGTMKFNRTKFDMVYGSGNFFKNLGDKMIHDEVKIDFKVVLK